MGDLLDRLKGAVLGEGGEPAEGSTVVTSPTDPVVDPANPDVTPPAAPPQPAPVTAKPAKPAAPKNKKADCPHLWKGGQEFGYTCDLCGADGEFVDGAIVSV